MRIFSPIFLKTYLESMSARLEEWRIRKKDTEEWMRHRQLPPELQERVRRFVQYQWLATRGVDEKFILRSLPLDLRREIQRHLCLSLVRRVRLCLHLFCFSLNQSVLCLKIVVLVCIGALLFTDG